MNELIFYVAAGSVCFFACLTVASSNIFHGAVWLSLTLLSVAGIYLILGAYFLGVVQVLVYVGGVITLFLFAIKLTTRIDDRSIRQRNQQVIPAAIAVFFLLFLFLRFADVPSAGSHFNAAGALSVRQIGESLLTTYALPFEFVSFILLAALVGAIVIGRTKE